MQLSVVIPTLNEATSLAETITALRARTAGPPVEVIVADCSSIDDTVAIATQCASCVVTGPELTNRARACNAGAAAATREAILFLHADCLVPQHYDALIREALTSPGVVCGAFEFKLDGPQWQLRLVEWVNRLRYRVRRRFFGDQGIFVRRCVFDAVGGFPEVGILEDARFCVKVRQVGNVSLVAAEMLTSPRRFYKTGILRTFMLDVCIMLADLVGLNPERFANAYRRDNIRRGLRPRSSTT